MLKKFEIRTQKEELKNITSYLYQAIADSGIKDGTALVYCPHTTAAITINENADPDVTRDLLYALNRFFPDLREYQHFEGNSKAHLKSSLIGVSESIIIKNGEPVLGRWQSVYFCEFDGPRNRSFYINITD